MINRQIITPIPDRTEIAYYAQKLFHHKGNAIEVGVWEGEFAANNLLDWKGNYWLCDAWQKRPETDAVTDKNHLNTLQWYEVQKKAINNTSFAMNRVKVIQEFSVKAAERFEDGFFDWIYIDAMHDYQSVLDDLRAWYPKLRQGGLFSGDDYGLHEDYERISADAFAAKCSPFGKIYKWGTVQAVNEFCIEKNLQHNVTWLNDKNNPAWYLIKS